MERRIVLLGLAAAAGGAFAPASASAQSGETPPTDAPAAPATPAPSAPGLAPAPAMKTDMPIGTLSEAVKTHIKDTMATGSLSLLISRIAQAKLKHPMGKQFADFEAAEQDGIADVLKSRMTPGVKPMGTIVAPTDTQAEDNLDAAGKEMLAKFRAMKEGPEMEKAYVAAEIDGHKKLLAVQDAYLKVADDEDETNIAKLAKGRIQEHLTILADIEKHLG